MEKSRKFSAPPYVLVMDRLQKWNTELYADFLRKKYLQTW